MNFVYRLPCAIRALEYRLLPPRCLICTAAGMPRSDLCADCRAALPWNDHACRQCGIPLLASAPACGDCLRRQPPLHETHAVFVYRAPVERLLLRFKFHQDLAAGRLLSELLIERIQTLPRPQAIVPIPLHAGRLRQRGYDQALELARPAAHATGVPLCMNALRRIHDTTPQSELGATARRRNLLNAFAVKKALPPHIALIDDVMTTGATLYAAANALRRTGVQRVDAWVCARVA